MTLTITLRTISALAVLAAVALAVTTRPETALGSVLAGRSDGDLMVHRIPGTPSGPGTCVADLTVPLPAGTAMRVEAVRAYSFAKDAAGGVEPSFVLTAGQPGSAMRVEMPVRYANPTIAYFRAEVLDPMVLTAGAPVTAVASIDRPGRAPLSCRFQVEGRLVPMPGAAS